MPTPIDADYVASEAEASLVAALFSADGMAAYDSAVMLVEADEFVLAECKTVFSAFADLVAKSITPDATTLASRIKSSESYSPQLAQLISDAAALPYSLDNVGHYAKAIHEKAVARQLKARLDELGAKTKLVGGDVSSEDLLRDVDAVSLGFEKRAAEVQLLQPPETALKEFIDAQEAAQSGEMTGVSTGIAELDRRVTMTPGDLVIVAGRPSMGKSAFAFNVPLSAARGAEAPDNDTVCAVFSLEMQTKKLMHRFLANLGSIDHDNLKRSRLTDEEWGRLPLAMERYRTANIFIDTDVHLTPSILRNKLRLLKARTKKKIGLIIVDYIQLMSADQRDNKHSTRADQVASISRNLKMIAKEEEAVMVALSQLNRGVENRPDKRPVMADLRESGAIEQDADLILLIYRDEYYNIESQWKGQADIIIGKARDGGGGSVATNFRGAYQQFTDLSHGAASYESRYE